MSVHRFVIVVRVPDAPEQRPSWEPEDWDDRDLSLYLRNGRAELVRLEDHTQLKED